MDELKNRISIFEGMVLRPIHFIIWGIPLLIAALFISGIVSTILWIVLGVGIFIFLIQLIERGRNPWRRIHFPLMNRYFSAIGMENSRSQEEGREADMRKAAILVLKSIYPEKNEVKLNMMLNKLESNICSKENIRKIASFVANDNTQENIDKIESHIDKFLEQNKGEDFLIVCIIADIVKKIYGKKEQIRYLWASFRGKAY